MKKLLLVISDDKYVISHRLSLIIGLIKLGKDVTVATKITDNNLKKKIEDLGCNVIDLKVRASNVGFLTNLKLIFLLRCVLHRYQPDLVAAYSIRIVFLSLIAFKFSRARRFIGTITGFGNLETSQKVLIKIIKKIVLKTFKLLLSSKNTKIVVQNRHDLEFVKRNLIDQGRVKMILGSGVDINYFQQQPQPVSEKIVVTIVSRMLKDKGILESVEAVKILYESGLNICLQLVGDIFLENPASLSETELNTISDLPFVNWLGFRSDIREIWQSSHIALLASSREGLPKSLLEAAACGRPIVTTDVPGCSEVVMDGSNGYLVPLGDVQKLSGAIKKLATDRQMRNEMGKKSRDMVERCFAGYIINRQTIDFFHDTKHCCVVDSKLGKNIL